MGAPDGLSLMASTSSAAIDVNSPTTSGNHTYQVNIRIMIAAIVVLFTVILFILSLHLYARWFWKNSQLAARRRRIAQLQQIHEIQQQIQAADDDHFYHFRHPDGYNPHLFASSAAIGLDKELIDKLPLFVFDECDNKQPDDLCCAVCLCEFQKGDRARMLPGCGHSFHTDCIDVWLHCHSTCPLCRQSLVLDEVESHVVKSRGGSLLLLPCSPIVADLDHLIILSSDLQDGSSSSTSSAAAAAVSLVSESSDNLQEQLHQIQLVLESGEATKSSSSKSSSSSSSSTSARSRWRNLRRLLGLPNSSQVCESTSTSTAATVAASSSGSSPV